MRHVKRIPASRSGLPHVALIVETSTSFGRRLLGGIVDYLRENAPWTVYFTERSVYDPIPPWLTNWTGDGIISRVESPEIRQIVAGTNVPVVDLNEQSRGLAVSLISTDHAAIGRLAAEHLLERGFIRFGYVGHPGLFWSDRRFQEFAAIVANAGYSCEEYCGKTKGLSSLRHQSWEMEMGAVTDWVAQLPKPIGIMACNDFRAVQLSAACRIADVAVPEEVAILGVGGDDVACQLGNPPLSSVILNPQRMGYEAAALLDRLMRGESPPTEEMKIPPLEVVTRQSTDVTAIADPVVAQAMRFIREHACEGINVEDVIRHVRISRSALQDHFRNALDRSINDVIVGARTSRARELLAQTTLSLQDVAERAGFKHAEYMSHVFKERTGWSPAKYREEHGQKTVKPFQVRRDV